MGEKIGVIVGDIQGDFTEWKEGSLAVPGSGGDFVKKVEEATALYITQDFLSWAFRTGIQEITSPFTPITPARNPLRPSRLTEECRSSGLLTMCKEPKMLGS